MRVGFVGLGSMGGDQSACLAEAGFDLAVYDVHRPAMERFAGKAHLATSIADLGHGADVVGICVRDDKQVRDTLEGPGGLLANMPTGSIILIHSTVSPETIHALAALAAERKIELVDAAVARTVFTTVDIKTPFVFVLAGGDEAVIERARPVLNAYATDILHVGKLGTGMALKIINNLLSWTSIVGGIQAFHLATASGIDLEALRAVVARNSNLTSSSKAITSIIFGGEPNADYMASQSGIGEKDLSLAVEFAQAVGVSVSMGEQAILGVRTAMTSKA